MCTCASDPHTAIHRLERRTRLLLLPGEERAASSGAPIAHTTSTTSSSIGNERPLFNAARTVSDSAAAGSSLANTSSASGSSVERIRHPTEEQQHEEQPVGEREVGLRAQRSGHEHADPRERDGADEQQRDRGDEAAGTAPAERDAGDDDRERLDDLEHEHVERLGGRGGRRATAASTRGASARRSDARSRWRCRGSPSRSPSPRGRALPARGSRPGPSAWCSPRRPW